jgi:hypothetical protein
VGVLSPDLLKVGGNRDADEEDGNRDSRARKYAGNSTKKLVTVAGAIGK